MKHAKYMKMALALLMAGAIGGFVYGEWQGESKPVSSESTRLIDWSGVMQVDAGTYSMHILMFDGAVNHDDLGMLPVYHERIALETEYVRAEVKLIAGIYEPLLIDENIVVEDIGLAGDQARIITSVSIARGQPFLDIYLLPLRKDKNTGLLEKLISFSLDIDIKDPGQGPSGQEASVQGPSGQAASGRPDRQPAEHSVLNSGRWQRIAVFSTGVHKITYEQLQEMGLENADPRNIRIYGNGNGMLPEPNSVERADDLLENAILVVGEEDGSLDPGDHVLFYGLGPVKWTYSSFFQQYNHINNIYTKETNYFVTVDLGPGMRIQSTSSLTEDPDFTAGTIHDYAAHEMDEINLIKSGKQWYGEVFSETVRHEFEFRFPDIDLQSPVYLKLNLAARSTIESNFYIYADETEVFQQEIVPISLSSPVYARSITTQVIEFMPVDDIVRIAIVYDKPTATSTGWLNYIELNATRHMAYHGGQMPFRNTEHTGDSLITQYELDGAGADTRFWDISDPWNISEITGFGVNNGQAVRVMADTIMEFIAFDGTEFHQVELLGEVENQDLHGLTPPEMIIIAYPLFMVQAQQVADHHRNFDGMSVEVVTPQQIYNEYSSGVQDVSAIRDFARMLYLNEDRGARLAYMLMFGDASYDYLDRLPENSNLVPTFQSRESLQHAASFVTDDFFGEFDESEGSNAAGTVDIGIGRFPVQTTEQAREAVDKIIHYALRQAIVMGGWRNRICFIADDGDINIHLKQAEELTEIVASSEPVYNISKIYLDAYTQISTPSGNRYPEVNEAIDKTVRDGALIVNYTGHGGELGWADERVLDIPMINGWDNLDRMPSFVTATCEFSRFDDPGHTSAGELVFLNPDGGGISLFTTTRLAYSQSNFSLNKRFYEHAFDTVDGSYQRMGDVFRHAKTPSNTNIRNFVLLGDPALMLAYPQESVNTLEIYDEYVHIETDTLSALSKVTVSGMVVDKAGGDLADFNGLISPVLFDKYATYRTLANDGSSIATEFLMQNNVLYRGNVTISKGAFSFTFIVPRDIAYQVGDGKLSYYVYDTINYRDGHDYFIVPVGGVHPGAPLDEKGPEIDIFLNHFAFKSGDITTNDPLLMAFLADESGLNTVGNGIGHDITAVIDGRENDPIILNDYYVPDRDTYQSGTINRRLGNLENGLHTLTLKAWDVYNNSSEAMIEFIIDSEAPVNLTMVYNYPNPFSTTTTFTFNHNNPGQELDIKILIFNMAGQIVTIIEDSFSSELLISDPITWDGKNIHGDIVSSGLYVYRIIVRSDNGKVDSQTNKLLFIR